LFGTSTATAKIPEVGPCEIQKPKFGEVSLVGVTVPLS
jgi:hypothetical protein